LPGVVERERVGVALCISQLCLGLALTGRRLLIALVNSFTVEFFKVINSLV